MKSRKSVEKRVWFKTKRVLFVIVALILLFIIFQVLRYSAILEFLYILPFKYFQLVKLISVVGFIVAVFSFWRFDKVFDVGFKKKHYYYILIMSVIAFLLSFLYFRLAYFDKLQHIFFPIMTASIVYYMISKLDLEKKYKLMFTFFAVVSVISVFELIEFSIDVLFNAQTQGAFIQEPSGSYRTIFNPIDDTMVDLLLGMLGGLIYVFSVCFWWQE